jgi:hypothetical protein
MDGAHVAGDSPEASSSSASSTGSASRRSRKHRGFHLLRRRPQPVRGGGGGGGGGSKGGAGDGVQDLALPLGMSFAAVLAQVSASSVSWLVLFCLDW